MVKVSKKTIAKRNRTRKINQLIDKFNLESNENKRIKIIEQIDNLTYYE